MSRDSAGRLSSPAGRHVEGVVASLTRIDLSPLARIAEVLADVRRREGQVFVAGNGGSAAVAEHLALSLTHDLRQRGAATVAATALTGASQVTAIANDQSVEEIFVGQLRDRLRPADALVAFSVSGRSENVLAALAYAAERNAATILITGAARVPAPAALGIALDCSDAAVAEDVFAVIVHALTALLAQGRA